MLNSQRAVTSSNASSGTCSGHAPAVSSRHLPRYKVHSKCSQLNNSSCCSSGGKCKSVVSCGSWYWAWHWQSWPQQWGKMQCVFSDWYELIPSRTHKQKKPPQKFMVLLLLWLDREGREEENSVTSYTLKATYSFARRWTIYLSERGGHQSKTGLLITS